MQDPRLELLQISGVFWSTDLIHTLRWFLVVEGDFTIQLDFLCRAEYQVLERVIEIESSSYSSAQYNWKYLLFISNLWLFPQVPCHIFFSQGNTRLSQSAKINSAKRFAKREFAPLQEQSLVALPATCRHVTALQMWEHGLSRKAESSSPVSCLKRVRQTLTPLGRSAKRWKLCQCLKNLTALF